MIYLNKFKKIRMGLALTIIKYKLSYFSINHTYKFKQENFAQYEELT